MTTSPIVAESMSRPSMSNSDLRMAMIAGAGATLSVVALLARLAGILPAGPTTLIVLVGGAIGLKVAFSYAAKSASAPSRARVLALVSTVGLAISGVTILGALPHLTKTGGIGTFTTDLVGELWTLVVLAVVVGSVRTLGWRTFVGAGATGFLAVTALAVTLGRPVVTAFGPLSLFAVAFWVPLTEELCKAIPVIFVVVVALRRTAVRPSALDLMLLGAWTGAGFALYENATYGRAFFQLSTVPLLSLFFPGESMGSSLFGPTMLRGGHLVYSALVGLGVGLALLYGKRLRRPGIVLLAAVLASFVEHALANIFSTPGLKPPPGADLLLTLTLGGYLSSLLLIVGVGYALYLERRALGAVASRPEEWLQLLRPEMWFRLSTAEAQRRSVLLAWAQLAAPPSVSSIQERLA
jgi:RsiW-degrading membrane proteinase PrsW (M82 family)